MDSQSGTEDGNLVLLHGSGELWGGASKPIPGPLRITSGKAFIRLETNYRGSAQLRDGYTGFEIVADAKPVGCPRDCSSDLGQGLCKNQRCECVTGWRGTGCEIGYRALVENFETATVGIPGYNEASWLDLKGAVFSFGCNDMSTSATLTHMQSKQSLTFDRKGERFIVSNAMDLSQGGYVSFNLRLGTGLHGSCEEQGKYSAEDGRTPGADVLLQYQLNGTSSWTTFPKGVFSASPYQTLRLIEVAIPDPAKQSDVKLRWIQPVHAPIRFHDVWAINSIQVMTPFVCPTSKGKVCGGRGTCFATNTCKCDENFYGASCTNACFVNYWHETVCGCSANQDIYSSST